MGLLWEQPNPGLFSVKMKKLKANTLLPSPSMAHYLFEGFSKVVVKNCVDNGVH